MFVESTRGNEGEGARLRFANWWKVLEPEQRLRLASRDTLVAKGISVENAPAHWFVRDPEIGARHREPAVLPNEPPSTGDPPQGEFVYYEEPPTEVSRPELVYPEAARQARVEGKVILHVLVGRDGSVKNVRVARGVMGLNEAALKWATGFVFKPALSEGKAVAVWIELPVEFRL